MMISIFKKIKKVPLKPVLLSFAVALFAYINYCQKNRFFAVFIVGFVVLMLLTKWRLFVLVIIPVLFIMFFNSTIVDSLSKIKNTTMNVLASPSILLNNLFRSNTGQDTFDWDIQWMNKVIKERGLQDYLLSPNLFSDIRIRQRIVETSWPVKLEDLSSNVFIDVIEAPSYQECDFLDKKMDIMYVYCP